jgi:hypothetical protein
MADTSGNKLVAFLLYMTIWALMVLMNGFVFHTLWGWFVVPLGVARLGLAGAIGFWLCVNFFTGPILFRLGDPEAKGKPGYYPLLRACTFAAMSLGMGAIVHAAL